MRRLVRSEGLEPPRCYSLPPQGSASTNSATSALGKPGLKGLDQRRRCNKSTMGGQGLKASRTQGFAVALDLDRDAIAVNRHEVDRQVLESVGFGVQLDDGAAPGLDGPTDITSPSYGYPMVNGRETLDLTPFAGPRGNVVEWRISDSLVPYPEAVAAMEARAIAIAAQEAGELVWLLEHPPLYTSGTSGRAGDL